MKAIKAGILASAMLLVFQTGCTGTSVNTPDISSPPAGEDSTSPAAPSPQTVTESAVSSLENRSPEEQTETQGQEPAAEIGILRNSTMDMTIIVPLHDLTAAEESEPPAVECGPGETLSLSQWITEFSFETPSFSASQGFSDLYHYGNGSPYLLEFSGDGDEGYRLRIYNREEAVPHHQYLLETGLLHWIPVREGQKLFFMDLPHIPMEEILMVYPDAILPEGLLEVEWQGGYTAMLWCREPLYDVRIRGTSYARDAEDGTPLYQPVDWDSSEGFDLMPHEPLLTTMVSVGSSYTRAFRFIDSQGQEQIYLLGENGRGGDWSSLMFNVTENVLFHSDSAD